MANGESGSAVAQQFRVSRPTVSLWRKRFRERGIAGLHNEIKPGRPRSTSDESVTKLLNTALQTKPREKPYWSQRALANATQLSKSTVHRYLTLFCVRPLHRQCFRLAREPLFIEKVRDIVGLYVNPVSHVLALCADVTSQTEVTKHARSKIAMGFGYLDGLVHNYGPCSPSTLLTALDVANGSVLTRRKSYQRYQGLLGFLCHVERNVPSYLDVHLVSDTYATYTHLKVSTWLAQHPRFHLHCTPTYNTWLKEVQRWFTLIRNQAIYRESFNSVIDLKRKIKKFVEQYNLHPQPFAWIATAQSLREKLERLCKVTNGT